MYNKKYKYAVLWGFVRERQKINKFIVCGLVWCGDSTHQCRASGTKSLQIFILPTVGANFVRLLFGSPVGELSRSD